MKPPQKITKKQTKGLQKIAKNIVRQSAFHRENIISYFKVMIDASRDEFFEDSCDQLNSFLAYCYNEAIITAQKKKLEMK